MLKLIAPSKLLLRDISNRSELELSFWICRNAHINLELKFRMTEITTALGTKARIRVFGFGLFSGYVLSLGFLQYLNLLNIKAVWNTVDRYKKHRGNSTYLQQRLFVKFYTVIQHERIPSDKHSENKEWLAHGIYKACFSDVKIVRDIKEFWSSRKVSLDDCARAVNCSNLHIPHIAINSLWIKQKIYAEYATEGSGQFLIYANLSSAFSFSITAITLFLT